jgi:hypothetical protein
MTQQLINVGTLIGDNTGDPGRTAFQKINSNFGELYNGIGGAILLSGVAGTNTVTATSTTYTAYFTGSTVSFVAAGANTGATTLNINGLGAKAITKQGSTALTQGDIKLGQIVMLTYDGTRFQIIPSKIIPIVSVTDFGAVGDGVTDDTAAIQACINLYGSKQQIYFPAGTYKVASSIDLTAHEGIHLVGAGSKATEIVSTANLPVIKIAGSSSSVTNSTGVTGMTIRGSGQTNLSAHGISFAWTNTCYLHDLVFFSCRYAMNFAHNYQTDVSNIRVYGAGADQSYIGLYMEETDLTYIDNAIVGYNINVQGVTQAGFRIVNGQGSKFTSCEAGGTMVYGWHIGEPTTGTVKCQWIHFVNCLSDSCTSAAWLFRLGTATELSEMALSNCWAGNCNQGFYFDSCRAINVANALSIGHTNSAVVLNQSQQIVVTGCVFRGNNEAASATVADVMIQAGLYNTVADCTMDSNVAGKSIIEKTATNANNIYGNNLFQGATIIGALTQVFRNRGFKTEVAASVTVGAAITTVNISHSLGVTPPIGAINVHATTAMGLSTRFWVNNVTATTFDLNVDVAPGVAISFGWNISLSTLQG